jgi:hypothetical protein
MVILLKNPTLTDPDVLMRGLTPETDLDVLMRGLTPERRNVKREAEGDGSSGWRGPGGRGDC